ESSAGAVESAFARGGELRHKAVPGFLALTGGALVPRLKSFGCARGCGGARRLVHQFEFLAAAVAAAAAAASAEVRHVWPVPHSPRQSEASYALNLGRSFGRRPSAPLRHARAMPLVLYRDFFPAPFASASPPTSAEVRRVWPVPHSPRQSEASYALNLGRSFGRRPARLFGTLAPMLRIIDRDFSHGSWSLGLGSIADGAQRHANFLPRLPASIPPLLWDGHPTSASRSPSVAGQYDASLRQYADQPQQGDCAPDRGPRRSPSKIAHTLTQMATLC